MKAQFLGGQTFWETLKAFRVCWYRGRYGGGKTSLAVLCAARLLAEGTVENVVSNIPLSFSVPPPEPFKDTAILLDESWIYLESRRDVVDYAGFVRKFNHYLLLPSVFPIHSRLSFFYVQRVFNAYSIGLPLWFFEWGIRDKVVKERGWFAILHPNSCFNHFPTNFVAGDDGGISDALVRTSKGAGFKGTRITQREQASAVVDLGGFGEVSEELEDFKYSMDFTLSDMEREAQKIARIIKR